ncbi:hypothetical protein RchiOBHm_Chr6g0268051 [Rosa chinensis]|uniref:Uncharacterized protein n=1 Tax=Rosa chinensis TaxID=74649 RepID=A0A2P6PQ61_ROSCH|nr:hypothetical protein RchiOBHm_Chr6g0268051 [Rosa chinensis]
MAVPLLKKAIVKKRVKQFKRPKSDCKICVRFCSFLRLNCSQKAWRSGFFHRRAIDSLSSKQLKSREMLEYFYITVYSH